MKKIENSDVEKRLTETSESGYCKPLKHEDPEYEEIAAKSISK
jgi:hypothetical protein